MSRHLLEMRAATAALAVACLLAAAPFAAAADLDAVARGAYLAGAAGCDRCHTDGEHGQPYAGGRLLATPFGAIPTPNITPDQVTGIGRSPSLTYTTPKMTATIATAATM